MTNVLHHIPDPRSFLREAGRCIRPGGVTCMVEPWVTGWSRLAYNLHSEPCLPRAPDWSPPVGGPLSGANGAVAWIIFERDRWRFEGEFPEWEVAEVRPDMPFCYLLSGGMSLRSLAPAWSYGPWRRMERLLEPWMDRLAMFATILLRRR
jgi:SAM-dependent methyltransferase